MVSGDGGWSGCRQGSNGISTVPCAPNTAPETLSFYGIYNKARKALTPGQELQSSKGLLHPVMVTLLLVCLQCLGPGFRVCWTQAKKQLPSGLWSLFDLTPWLIFCSSRPSTTCMPTPRGHRERVLSLSQALATEASQWRRLMTGEVPRIRTPGSRAGPRNVELKV